MSQDKGEKRRGGSHHQQREEEQRPPPNLLQRARGWAQPLQKMRSIDVPGSCNVCTAARPRLLQVADVDYEGRARNRDQRNMASKR